MALDGTIFVRNTPGEWISINFSRVPWSSLKSSYSEGLGGPQRQRGKSQCLVPATKNGPLSCSNTQRQTTKHPKIKLILSRWYSAEDQLEAIGQLWFLQFCCLCYLRQIGFGIELFLFCLRPSRHIDFDISRLSLSKGQSFNIKMSMQCKRCQMSNVQNPGDIPLYWWVHSDPYNGLL